MKYRFPTVSHVLIAIQALNNDYCFVDESTVSKILAHLWCANFFAQKLK